MDLINQENIKPRNNNLPNDDTIIFKSKRTSLKSNNLEDNKVEKPNKVRFDVSVSDDTVIKPKTTINKMPLIKVPLRRVGLSLGKPVKSTQEKHDEDLTIIDYKLSTSDKIDDLNISSVKLSDTITATLILNKSADHIDILPPIIIEATPNLTRIPIKLSEATPNTSRDSIKTRLSTLNSDSEDDDLDDETIKKGFSNLSAPATKSIEIPKIQAQPDDQDTVVSFKKPQVNTIVETAKPIITEDQDTEIVTFKKPQRKVSMLLAPKSSIISQINQTSQIGAKDLPAVSSIPKIVSPPIIIKRSNTEISDQSPLPSRINKSKLDEQVAPSTIPFKPISPSKPIQKQHTIPISNTKEVQIIQKSETTSKPIVVSNPVVKQSSPKQQDDLVGKVRVINGISYSFLELVGSGGTCKVYKVLGPKAKIFACKVLDLKTNDIVNLQNEVKLLKSLTGKSTIIQLYAAEEKNGELMLVFEYGEIDLNKLLQKSKGLISENFVRMYFQQMLEAVQTIHDARIVHADLKPANFMIVEGSLKLIDFGIAKSIGNDTTNIFRDGIIGSLNYMSPEAIDSKDNSDTGHKYGRPADVWALGCILYQMVYGKPPFSELKDFKKLMAIANPNHEIKYPSAESACSNNPYCIEVLKSCLQRDPMKRPTIPELLNHPFLNSTEALKREKQKQQIEEQNKIQLQALLQQLSSASGQSQQININELYKQIQSGQEVNMLKIMQPSPN